MDSTRKLSDRELRDAAGIVGDVRIHVERFTDGRSVRKAVCIGGTTEALPALIKPELAGMSPLSLGLEGFEEIQTASGIVFLRWCRMR